MIEHTDFNQLAKINCFPLHKAIQQGHVIAVFEILKKGYDLHLSHKNGETAFHYAAMSNSESLCKYILGLAKNIDIKTNNGRTPLFNAVKHNSLHGVKTLIELGANPNAKNECGNTPFQQIAFDTQLEIAKFLIEKGADVNAKGPNEWSTLMHSINEKQEALTELLLNQPNIDLNVKDVAGMSALTLATSRGMLKTVKTLLEKEGSPNSATYYGETLLHLAVINKNVEMCKFLLAVGADKSMNTKGGKTPLDYAIDLKHEELIRILT
jgi:ankyrin repeat protein